MMKRIFHERKVDAVVKLLDGGEFHIEITKSTLGRDIFDQVCQHVGLEETDFFGLKFVCAKDRQLSWIDNAKTVGKQMGNGPYSLIFRVKFYPPNPAAVNEDITRYQIVLQVRDDLLKERLICSVPIHALLASYLIQAEKGDYDPAEHPQDYIDGLKFMPNQDEGFLPKVHEFHKKHKGYTPADAEFHYLDNARKIPLYGMDLHDALDGDDTNVVLGVSANGLHVILKGREMSKFSWSNIHKVYFKSKRFYLDIRVVTERKCREVSGFHLILGKNTGQENGGHFFGYPTVEYEDLTIGFRCRSRTELKRLYRAAVDHHTFFRRDASIIGSQKVSFFRLGSKFRYSGKKTFQQLKTSSHSRPAPKFQRVSSQRLTTAQTKGKNTSKAGVNDDVKDTQDEKEDVPRNEKHSNDSGSNVDDGSPCISRNVVIAPSEDDSVKVKQDKEEPKMQNHDLAVTITISPPTPIPGERKQIDVEDSCEDYEVIESKEDPIKPNEGTSEKETVSSTQNEIVSSEQSEIITSVEKVESQSHEDFTSTKTSTTTTITTKTEIITVDELNDETVVVEEERIENVNDGSRKLPKRYIGLESTKL